MEKIILIKSKKYFVIMIIKSIIKSDIIRTSQENIEKATHSICNLRYKISKEFSVAFHDVSTYDYHFIIKELAKEFEGQSECLGQNTEKYITFSVSINKSKVITKLSKLIRKYKLKFIDSFRFMSTLLSKLVNNSSEFYSKKCRDKDCKSECEFKGLENNKLCKECRKNGYNQ